MPRVVDGDPLPPDHDRPLPAPLDLSDLFRSEQPRLLRLLSRRASLDQAQDTIQQIFCKLVSLGEREMQSIESPSAYLRVAARNSLRDDARSAARSSQRQHAEFEDNTLCGLDPVAALEARDRLARIEAAVARLKPLTRNIFLARRLDGYSYAEIAARTGLSERGVEKQMRMAIRQLGRHLRNDA